VSVRT